jgi:hypothetical protein
LARFEPMHLGYNGKHVNHYTTENIVHHRWCWCLNNFDYVMKMGVHHVLITFIQ